MKHSLAGVALALGDAGHQSHAQAGRSGHPRLASGAVGHFFGQRESFRARGEDVAGVGELRQHDQARTEGRRALDAGNYQKLHLKILCL